MNLEKINVYYILMFVALILGADKPLFFETYFAVAEWCFLFGLAKMLNDHHEQKDQE